MPCVFLRSPRNRLTYPASEPPFSAPLFATVLLDLLYCIIDARDIYGFDRASSDECAQCTIQKSFLLLEWGRLARQSPFILNNWNHND